jgi:hypothetical protein
MEKRTTLATRLAVSTYHDSVYRRDVLVEVEAGGQVITLNGDDPAAEVVIELTNAERIALIEALGGTH